MKNIEIKIYKNFSNDLMESWKQLETMSQNYFFQSYEWQKMWFEKQFLYNNQIQNYSISILRDNKIIMILPLNINHKYGVKILSWSGFPFSDYNAPLVKNGENINQEDFLFIWNKLISKRDFDCIILDNQPEKIIDLENPFFKFLNNKINNHFYGISFSKKFDIKKKELDNIKYQTNRLKNLGKLDFKFAQDKNEIEKIIDFIILNKSNQFKRTNAWNLFNLKIHKDFFVSSNQNLKENISLCYLSLDDEIIAAQSGFKYKKRYYYLFPAYKYEYSKFSPGKILLEKLISKNKFNLINYFDLTIGSEKYKENFSNTRIASAIFLKSNNLKGLIYILFLKFKFIIKLILRK